MIRLTDMSMDLSEGEVNILAAMNNGIDISMGNWLRVLQLTGTQMMGLPSLFTAGGVMCNHFPPLSKLMTDAPYLAFDIFLLAM